MDAGPDAGFHLPRTWAALRGPALGEVTRCLDVGGKQGSLLPETGRVLRQRERADREVKEKPQDLSRET